MIKQFYRSVCFASVMLFLVGSSALHAQTLITGKISDKAGQALPGVNVIKKGTTSGTSTDANGNYSIEATGSDILVVSFIGYQSQEIVVGNRPKSRHTVGGGYCRTSGSCGRRLWNAEEKRSDRIGCVSQRR